MLLESTSELRANLNKKTSELSILVAEKLNKMLSNKEEIHKIEHSFMYFCKYLYDALVACDGKCSDDQTIPGEFLAPQKIPSNIGFVNTGHTLHILNLNMFASLDNLSVGNTNTPITCLYFQDVIVRDILVHNKIKKGRISSDIKRSMCYGRKFSVSGRLDTGIVMYAIPTDPQERAEIIDNIENLF